MTTNQQTNFLAETFEPDSFIFQKPKKYKNSQLMTSKIRNRNNENIIIQFPKMAVEGWDNKVVNLEFMNSTNYNKKVQNFLSQLNEFVINHICCQSETWFGKNIPLENIKNMYNDKLKFVFDNSTSQLIDKRENDLDTSEISKGVILESICLLKYLVFTKDSCFLHWEICTAKVHKKTQRVPLFGFIEDTDDHSESDEENLTFW